MPASINQATHLLRQQESLREIIESISSELELRPLLTLIVQRACELLAADNGTIGLVDEQRNVVRTEAAYQMPADELGAECGPGVGLFGAILLNQAPLILNRYGDVAQPVQLRYLDHAIIGVPIHWRGQLLGAFGLGSAPPRQFTDQDCEVLTLLARHAAIAIANAQLYATTKRRTERSAIINQISRQISSSLDIDQISQAALTAINAHLHYTNVALLLVDLEEPTMLVLRARSGIYAELAPTHYRQSIHVGVIGAAARSHQTILVADVHQDPRYVPVPGVVGIQAELAIPLVTAHRLIGVLNLEAQRPIPADTIADLETIADQLSAAIDHAHRYQEEKRRTERIELIARVGQRIAARLDPHELFTTTIQELYTQLGYDHIAFFVVDPAAPTWLEQRAYASRWPAAGRIGYRQSIEQGIIGAAARKRQPELVNQVTADRRYIPVSEQDDMQAELAIPILAGEQLLGIFDIGSRKPFRADDVKALQIITDQLAVAIEQSSLFANTQRALQETELLYQTSQRISVALDIAEVVQAYLEQVAVQGNYACHVALYELDEENQRRQVRVYGRWTPQHGLDCPLEIKLPYSRDALDEPLDAGQTVTISNVHTDPRVNASLRAMQAEDGRPALAMIPLMGRNQRIGLVILSYPAVHDWPISQLHLYQITAAQLATAIDSHLQRSLIAKHDQRLAVLEERRRLARELHDSVTQLLFSITLIAQSLGSAWRRNPSAGEQRIQRLLELSQAALAEMRALLVELRPTDEPSQLQTSPPLSLGVQVQKLGLVVALQSYLATLREHGLQIQTETTEYHRQAADQEEAMFRIIQEALNNIVKHAQATHVQITLAVHKRLVTLRVQDNGVGFTLPGAAGLSAGAAGATSGGMGLQTMRERATALGGSFTLTTTPGQGTTVEVVAPQVGTV